MRKKVIEHFKVKDPKLFRAIDSDIKGFSLDTRKKTPKEYFISLCKGIVGQQLSGKAADSIYMRFEDMFPQKKVTAEGISRRTEHELRGVGMSYAKARALLDYADKYLKKEIHFRNVHNRTNEEIQEMLLSIKGVGPWTTEMFLMFALGREDVFSPKDLGLQKGIQKVYSMRTRPDEKKVEQLSKKWSPYRTYASIVLWHAVDNQ